MPSHVQVRYGARRKHRLPVAASDRADDVAPTIDSYLILAKLSTTSARRGTLTPSSLPASISGRVYRTDSTDAVAREMR